MARPIILSNGEMHIGLNEHGLVDDFYYPYVGGENHTAARGVNHRVGLWIDGAFTWLDDGSWEISFEYLPHSLVGITKAKNSTHGVALEFTDTVDSEQSAFVRNIHIMNCRDAIRDIRLFMHQMFVISNSYASDTAQFLPEEDALIHYKGLRTFIVSGATADQQPFDQYCVGLNGIEGREGVFRDAEDGELSGNNVEHGRVDSVMRFMTPLDPHDSTRVQYWVAAGKSQREALLIHKKVRADGTLHRLLVTDKHWDDWSMPARKAAKKLPAEYQEGFLQSIMIIKTHLDKRGAVIASTDTTMLNYSRDAYAYCWPRDAGHVLWPLIRLGYVDEPLHFFMFCRRVLHSGGYLMHKYQPDGAVGTSWHPYVHDGTIAPPIQEDETAIVLFLFSQYYHMHKDEKLLREFYPTMIAPMANFMASYVDEKGMPKPTYDLWEEVFITATYTTSLTYGALCAAANLAEILGNSEDALRWQTAADGIREQAQESLVHEGLLIKGIRPDGTKDTTLDASALYGAFMFGLFDNGSATLLDTFQAMKTRLAIGGGIVRYENDKYNLADPDSVGNPWFVTSLWLAQFSLEHDMHEEAHQILQWTKDHMLPTGVLSEQIDPRDGSMVSVAPLVWSSAEYASCLLDLTSTLPTEPSSE